MKRYKLLLLVLQLILGSYLSAQVPQRIPYRAMIRHNGAVLSSQIVEFRFTIFTQGSTIVYPVSYTHLTLPTTVIV